MQLSRVLTRTFGIILAIPSQELLITNYILLLHNNWSLTFYSSTSHHLFAGRCVNVSLRPRSQLSSDAHKSWNGISTRSTSVVTHSARMRPHSCTSANRSLDSRRLNQPSLRR